MNSGRTTMRAGVTLLELLVVLVILAISTGITGVALNSAPRAAPPTFSARIAHARRDAIRSGRSVTLPLHDSTGVHVVRVSPDGTVLGASPFAVEWASGRPANAPQ